MKRFSISLVLATVSTFFGYSAFGHVLQPEPGLKTIATVVVHAHHAGKLTNFVSATDKL